MLQSLPQYIPLVVWLLPISDNIFQIVGSAGWRKLSSGRERQMLAQLHPFLASNLSELNEAFLTSSTYPGLRLDSRVTYPAPATLTGHSWVNSSALLTYSSGTQKMNRLLPGTPDTTPTASIVLTIITDTESQSCMIKADTVTLKYTQRLI